MATIAKERLIIHGGGTANRCYQCATCSAVCDLAPDDSPFPRQQMLLAQWGQIDKLAGDPAVWLCHQCNDCNVRCPRDAQPGDVMQAIRATVVESLATPGFMGKLVGNVKKTWPLLVFVPILFWVVLLGATTQFHIHDPHDPTLAAGPTMGQFFYDQVVPHYLIYGVYFTAVGLVCLALFASGMKFWKSIGDGRPRKGSFISALIGVFTDIALHNKFSSCNRGVPKRRWGHFLVMWGFIGAAITSGFAVVYLYRDTVFFKWLGLEIGYPTPVTHWVKLLGNFSAVILVVGGIMLLVNRFSVGDRLVGATTAFDRFFLWVVLAVIGTGVATEVVRYAINAPTLGLAIYILHLGVVLCLFITLPYSKFAHILYRTLALIHERMTK